MLFGLPFSCEMSELVVENMLKLTLLVKSAGSPTRIDIETWVLKVEENGLY